ADTPSARALDVRHQAWANTLPKEPEELWDALDGFDADSRQALFAHCVALSVNAVIEPYTRRPRAILHADRLAQAVDLDMAGAGWTPTVDG
ncbi:DNA-binding protein, partial [Pseudomonas aeruginosa]|nr:DNA-binding protein [Pseudomonas aeruginosa]